MRPGEVGVDSNNPDEVTRVVEPSSSAVGLERTGEDDEPPAPPLAVAQLTQGTAFGRYIASTGHLFYSRSTVLLSVPLDLATLATGEPTAIFDCRTW
mgnify:CR=1 FL=1